MCISINATGFGGVHVRDDYNQLHINNFYLRFFIMNDDLRFNKSIGGKRGLNSLQRWGMLLILAGLAGCASLTSSISSLEPPTVSLTDINLKKLGLFEQRFVLRLRLQNPNNIPLPIAGMRYDLAINDQDFARGVSEQVINVPAFGETMLDVDVTSNLQNVLDQLAPKNKSTEPLRYQLRGHVGVLNRSLKLPFDYKGSIDLSRLTNL